jgi:hypothetical protein
MYLNVGLGPGYAPLVPAERAAPAQNPLLVEAGCGGGVGLQGAAWLPLHRGGAGPGAREWAGEFLAAAFRVKWRVIAPTRLVCQE